MTDSIEQIVEDLNEKFPTAELSFGYLFNHPCAIDQQQWYIFTQVPQNTDGTFWSHPFPRKHKYSCSGAGRMDDILAGLKGPGFQKWLLRLQADLGSSRHQAWHRKIHANDCPNCGRKPNSTGVQRVDEREKVGTFRRYDGVRYREVNNCIDCQLAGRSHQYPRVA